MRPYDKLLWPLAVLGYGLRYRFQTWQFCIPNCTCRNCCIMPVSLLYYDIWWWILCRFLLCLWFTCDLWCFCVSISLLGKEASPSIGNTLWHVSTMFTHLAITPPEVNGFGLNLGNSEYIVWSWSWQILGTIRAEARAGDLAEVLFFLSGKQCTTADFRSANFHEICTHNVFLWRGESYRKHVLKICT